MLGKVKKKALLFAIFLILIATSALAMYPQSKEMARAQSWYYDFAGTDYDTPSKMNAAGVAMSDVQSVFMTGKIKYNVQTIDGTWVHSTGNGWVPTSPASPSSYDGPVMLLSPLLFGNNLEAVVTYTYTPTDVNNRFLLALSLVNSNFGALHAAINYDNDLVATKVIAGLETSDGDGSATNNYTGSDQTTVAGDLVLKTRRLNGTVGVWDLQDSSWHNYTAAASHSPEGGVMWALQVTGYTTGNIAPIVIKSVEYYMIDMDGNRI